MDVIFYEKPGCANNKRQRRLLEGLRYRVEVRDLLAHPWTAAELRSFFGDKPVTDWINPAAPAVTSGAVDPSTLTEEAALTAMLADPLLIRRPLIEASGQRLAGFDLGEIRALLDLPESLPVGASDIPETCQKQGTPCATPERVATEADMMALTQRFYTLARADARLGPFFAATVDDWPAHEALVADFWSHALLGTHRYKGHPFPVHQNLGIEPGDFDLWLRYFTQAATETLPASLAKQALKRAHHMSGAFKAGLFLPTPRVAG